MATRDKAVCLVGQDEVPLGPTRDRLASAFGAVAPLRDTSVNFDDKIEEAMVDDADQRERERPS